MCPHCQAEIIFQEGSERYCLICGWREDIGLLEPPVDLRYWMRQSEGGFEEENEMLLDQVKSLIGEYNIYQISKILGVRSQRLYRLTRRVGIGQNRERWRI